MTLQTADVIAKSKRTELYLGVVAPVGIRRESFQSAFERVLGPFGYEVETVRLSELLEDFKGISVDKSNENARLTTAMDAGSKLREEVGGGVLARAAILEVVDRRSGGHTENPCVAYVFWSLKHPEEVATLRLVYGGSFHLVGLFASEEERIQELKNRPGINEADARGHVARDREEPGKDRGQRTRDTFHRADVFLEWGTNRDERGLERFVEVLFGRPDLSPKPDEHCMFLAHASALRSGELSRQVGAALVSAEGDVVALGANDLPRRGGGLYWPGPDDDRDAVRGQDSNISVRRKLLADVAQDVGAENPEDLVKKLEDSKLKGITEYGRAVHAEMETLLACARSGRSTRGTTLYVTTYPCHNCARHIIAAGVVRVVYIEPYPKSRALELHEKDIVEVRPGAEVDEERVRFEPYLGIGPRRFFDYFSMHLGDGYEVCRKDELGALAPWTKGTAAPRVQSAGVPLSELEKILGGEVVDFLVDPS